MAPMDDRPDLRAHIPPQEPDPVLLGRLVELSAASSAAAARSPLRGVRALTVGAAAFGLVAATTWIAGALPGVSSPLTPDPAPPPAPSSPATPVRTEHSPVPSADAGSTSGASDPHHEAPDVVPSGALPSPATTGQPTPDPSAGWGPSGWPTGTTTGQPGADTHGWREHRDQGRHRGGRDPQGPGEENGHGYGTGPGTGRGRGGHSPGPTDPSADPSSAPTTSPTTSPTSDPSIDP
jgi:hypothetical protein